MGLKDAFGKNSAAYQLFVYQVMGQVVGAILGPTLELVAQEVNAIEPTAELSPADLANAVVQSYISQADAAHSAARSGLDAGKFGTLVDLAGDALAPDALAEALRRGLIPEGGRGAGSTSFEQGIAEGRLKNKWAGIVKELAVRWPTPADALDALLEGQISEADARSLYAKFGGDPQYFTMLYDTRGNAPTPVEALEMANRGIIPWTGTGPAATSFEQAFLEGPWRNKWEPAFRGVGEYLPPPRTITAMVRNGSLAQDVALSLLMKQGLTHDLAAAYIHDALNGKAETHRELTVAQLLDLYAAGLISADDAKTLLVALKYSADSADELLAYKDLQRAIAATRQAVSRVHTLYVNHKIDRANAGGALNSLAVPAPQIDQILRTWDIERGVNVKVLTEAQIVDAWKYDIIDQDEATAELVNIGYTPRDAWILLSVKNHGALQSAPPQGPASLSIPGGTP